MNVRQIKILIPILIIIISVGVLAFSLANNSKTGLNLPIINTGNNNTEINSSNPVQKNDQSQVDQQSTETNQQSQTNQKNNGFYGYGICTNCGSDNIEYVDVYEVNDKDYVTIFKCLDCGNVFESYRSSVGV